MKEKTIACKTCGQLFVVRDPRRMYCSANCNSKERYRRKRRLDPIPKQKVCDQCRTIFKPYTKRSRFCSEKCHTTWGNEHKEYPHTCEGCGNSFVSRLPKSKYCSRGCGLSHTKVIKKLTCVDCGVKFKFVGRTRKHRCDACSKRYWNDYYNSFQTGERRSRDQWRAYNPSWLHDSKYRRIVRALPGEVRYKYRNVCYDVWPRRCAICGSLENVEVHHISGDRTNYSLENLVPLCKKHHTLVHKKPNKLAWSTEDYRKSLFSIWPEGRQILGAVAKQFASKNLANSVNALPVMGRANAELVADKVTSVETIHEGSTKVDQDIVRTTTSNATGTT